MPIIREEDRKKLKEISLELEEEITNLGFEIEERGDIVFCINEKINKGISFYKKSGGIIISEFNNPSESTAFPKELLLLFITYFESLM